MYKLTTISRQEVGLTPHHSFSIFLVMILSFNMYIGYFALRPQVVSTALIIWFFIYMREFVQQAKMKYFILLPLFSILIANFHSGVWIILPAFLTMAGIELMYNRAFRIKHAIVITLTLISGILNAGGIKTILFFFTITDGGYNKFIQEWMPVSFSATNPRTILLLCFVAVIPFVIHKSIFRLLFILGILYLGVSSYKENLYMWIFFPFITATVFDRIPLLNKLNFRPSNKLIIGSITFGLMINVFYVFMYPISVNNKAFPVEEMDYILSNYTHGDRPNVLAMYDPSGYIMFKGGNVLADGRQDPFITDASKGIYGWNAFERSVNVKSFNLPAIASYDKPDYIIVPSTKNRESYEAMVRTWELSFGKPVFEGAYGIVYRYKHIGGGI